MSENQSSQTGHEHDQIDTSDSSMDDTAQSLTESALEQQMTPESSQPEIASELSDNAATTASANATTHTDKDIWTDVDLPGTVLPVDPTGKTSADTPSTNTELAESNTLLPERENELLTLIHDLNECNDVLLARVSQLETSLEDSRQHLQNETEKAKATQSKMAEQVSVEQAAAQQVSQNAQQQVANLVDQLEDAEQASRRQQLINETLLSELDNAQERVAQLEHECALSAQQHAEEAQARVKAETTIRDLRSRLQRQQRYTLQFKAALEKSLTVTSRSASIRDSQPINPASAGYSAAGYPAAQPIAQPVSFQESPSQGGVSMPKAQRIMPWAGAVTTPFEGIDPHLENLIRGASAQREHEVQRERAMRESADFIQTPEQSPSAVADASPASTSDIHNTDGDAESQLWQDIQRVIDHAEPAVESTDSTETDSTEIDTNTANVQVVEASSQQTDDQIPADQSLAEPPSGEPLSVDQPPADQPKFNWQSQPAVSASAATAVDVNDTNADKTAAPEKQINEQVNEKKRDDKQRSDIPSIVIDPYTVPVGQSPEAEVGFTEPSPWGQNASERSLETALNAKIEESADSSTGEFLPLVEGDTSSVSPVVNPLRPQKKIGSLASVQLPTFERAKAASFKR